MASSIANSSGDSLGYVCNSQVSDISSSRQLVSDVQLGTGHFRICHDFCLIQSQEALLTYLMCTDNIIYAASESFWKSPTHCSISVAFSFQILTIQAPSLCFIRTVALFPLAGRAHLNDMSFSLIQPVVNSICQLCTR